MRGGVRICWCQVSGANRFQVSGVRFQAGSIVRARTRARRRPRRQGILFDGVRFFHIFAGAQLLGFFNTVRFRKAAGNDRFLFRMYGNQFFICLEAVHPRGHDHIQDNEIGRV